MVTLFHTTLLRTSPTQSHPMPFPALPLCQSPRHLRIIERYSGAAENARLPLLPSPLYQRSHVLSPVESRKKASDSHSNRHTAQSLGLKVEQVVAPMEPPDVQAPPEPRPQPLRQCACIHTNVHGARGGDHRFVRADRCIRPAVPGSRFCIHCNVPDARNRVGQPAMFFCTCSCISCGRPEIEPTSTSTSSSLPARSRSPQRDPGPNHPGRSSIAGA
jgi:hypothetical protein